MLVMEFENLCVIIISHLVENPEPKDKWLPENVSYNEFGGRSTSGRLQSRDARKLNNGIKDYR